MKKTYITLALLFSLGQLYAQTSNNSVYANIGGGLTKCNYDKQIPTDNLGQFAAELGYVRQLKYGLGVGIGIRINNTGATAMFSKQLALEKNLIDSEGETYDLSTSYSDINEKHTLWQLRIPVFLQYQYMFTDKWGIQASAGLSVAFNMSRQNDTRGGHIATEAYYPEWNITLHDIDGIYESTAIETSKGKETAYRKAGVNIDLQAKALYRLTDHISLNAGIYYSQGISNMLSDGEAESVLVKSLENRKCFQHGIGLTIGVEYSF